MTDGFLLAPGAGEPIMLGTMAVSAKVTGDHAVSASTFEVMVPPGFDVGAHIHAAGEELFYVLEGELDLLAFEPEERSGGGWQAWTAPDGRRVARCGPGSLMFVPPGCPHAFANPGPAPARMLFQFAPPGHERYFAELSKILNRGGPPDPEEIRELRRRHGIEQLTPLRPGPAA
jgi:oxalate decarboxylase/phosphoglucose isomerase-like protein (cupin superfamily)